MSRADRTVRSFRGVTKQETGKPGKGWGCGETWVADGSARLQEISSSAEPREGDIKRGAGKDSISANEPMMETGPKNRRMIKEVNALLLDKGIIAP